MKKRTTKKKTGKTTEVELVKFVSEKYKLDTFWSWWLIKAIDIQADSNYIPVHDYCKSKFLHHFVSGFLAARSMQTIIEQQNN